MIGVLLSCAGLLWSYRITAGVVKMSWAAVLLTALLVGAGPHAGVSGHRAPEDQGGVPPAGRRPACSRVDIRPARRVPFGGRHGGLRRRRRRAVSSRDRRRAAGPGISDLRSVLIDRRLVERSAAQDKNAEPCSAGAPLRRRQAPLAHGVAELAVQSATMPRRRQTPAGASSFGHRICSACVICRVLCLGIVPVVAGLAGDVLGSGLL